MQYHFEKSYGLNETQLVDIQRLETTCNQFEGLAMKLNWSTLHDRPKEQSSDFLYYADSQLVGYLALYGFNQREVEVSAMTHPDHRRQGIFRQLLAAANLELKERQVPEFLFICERASASGVACMQAIAARYDFSEYKMGLQQAGVKPGPAPADLQLRPARPEDIDALVKMDESCFRVSADAAKRWMAHDLADSKRRILLATFGPVEIGKIHVLINEAETYISGFCLLPEYRRKGYGKIILTRTLDQLVADQGRPISLEVATENEHALSLYEHCGFRTITAYDYYRLPVDGAEG
ncbi:MAG TPA: GNAT family N-acetyltransferase [Anaerolineae bacterium]|nr:GNAT family N-acetyltransferase [Anaerolineae bacterium]